MFGGLLIFARLGEEITFWIGALLFCGFFGITLFLPEFISWLIKRIKGTPSIPYEFFHSDWSNVSTNV